MTRTIAVICGTSDQQTMRVAAQLATQLQQQGNQIEIYEAGNLSESFQPRTFDGVIVGAAMEGGEFPMKVNRVIRQLRADLHEMPSAFFSIMSSGDDEQKMRGHNEAFSERTQWYPVVMAAFVDVDNGASRGMIERMDVGAIGRRRLGEIDYDRDYGRAGGSDVGDLIEQFNDHIQHAEDHPEMPTRPGM